MANLDSDLTFLDPPKPQIPCKDSLFCHTGNKPQVGIILAIHPFRVIRRSIQKTVRKRWSSDAAYGFLPSCCYSPDVGLQKTRPFPTSWSGCGERQARNTRTASLRSRRRRSPSALEDSTAILALSAKLTPSRETRPLCMRLSLRLKKDTNSDSPSIMSRSMRKSFG